jgi:metal-responsive CopG/Arc/MetJ family transcriptional regulator
MSGKAMQRISLYFHRRLLAMIDEAIKQEPTSEMDENLSRSEWIREACRQRIMSTARNVAEEDKP